MFPKDWVRLSKKEHSTDISMSQPPAPEAASEVTVADQDGIATDKQEQQMPEKDQSKPAGPSAPHDDDLAYPTGIRLLLIMLSIFIGMFLVTLASLYSTFFFKQWHRLTISSSRTASLSRLPSRKSPMSSIRPVILAGTARPTC